MIGLTGAEAATPKTSWTVALMVCGPAFKFETADVNGWLIRRGPIGFSTSTPRVWGGAGRRRSDSHSGGLVAGRGDKLDGDWIGNGLPMAVVRSDGRDGVLADKAVGPGEGEGRICSGGQVKIVGIEVNLGDRSIRV